MRGTFSSASSSLASRSLAFAPYWAFKKSLDDLRKDRRRAKIVRRVRTRKIFFERGRPLRRPSAPGQDVAVMSPPIRHMRSEAVPGPEADNEDTQDHHEYFKHDPNCSTFGAAQHQANKTPLT